LARQHESPFPEERRQFLRHLKDLGYARTSLHDVACELVVITRHLDLSGRDTLDVAVVEAAARRWATDQIRRHRSATAARSTRNFRYWAEQWLRWWGRLKELAQVAPPPFQGLLDAFTAHMRDERGLTSASIRSHGWKTKTFLAWYWPQGRVFADVTVQDVDDFLTAKGRTTWSRRSVAVAVQALRAFFSSASSTCLRATMHRQATLRSMGRVPRPANKRSSSERDYLRSILQPQPKADPPQAEADIKASYLPVRTRRQAPIGSS